MRFDEFPRRVNDIYSLQRLRLSQRRKEAPSRNHSRTFCPLSLFACACSALVACTISVCSDCCAGRAGCSAATATVSVEASAAELESSCESSSSQSSTESSNVLVSFVVVHSAAVTEGGISPKRISRKRRPNRRSRLSTCRACRDYQECIHFSATIHTLERYIASGDELR